MKRERVAEVHFYEWRASTWAVSETRDRLDATGRGIYRELLDVCYTQGKFPDEPEWICRKCACTMEQYEKVWPQIVRHFPISNQSGYRWNLKSNIVRREYFDFVARQQQNGKKRRPLIAIENNDIDRLASPTSDFGSGLPQPNGNGNGNGNGKVNIPISTEETNISAIRIAEEGEFVLNGEPAKKRPLKSWYVDNHLVWYSRYWCKKGRQDSEKAYIKAINRLVDRDHLGYNAARLFLIGKVEWDLERFEHTSDWESRVKLHPATWLNQERWTDEVTPGPQLPTKLGPQRLSATAVALQKAREEEAKHALAIKSN